MEGGAPPHFLRWPMRTAPIAAPHLTSNASAASAERIDRGRWSPAALSPVADARGVTPDIIFTNETLLDIAQRAPQTEAELLAIPAIGAWKARTYGPDLFRIVHKGAK